MAVSPKAISNSPPKTDGGNALAALLAAAASTLHCQQQQQQHSNNQLHPQQQQQQSRSASNQKLTKVKSLHPSSFSSSATDKDSMPAAELLIKLVSGSLSNGITKSNKPTTSLSTSNNQTSTTLINNLIQTTATKTKQRGGPDHVELRTLETWHDEDEQPIDCYEELVDQSSANGWSADEMFKYNEKMHKITSSYNERTLSKNYTTPLPKNNSKSTMKLVTQLAREIEDRVIAEGRITPESSDDDELFENQRLQKVHLKQQKQLDQLRSLQQQHRFTNGVGVNGVTPQLVNTNGGVRGSTSKTAKSSSQYSNSTETPATISLSSSPTLNDIIIKPVTSSSRNILRTCLT